MTFRQTDAFVQNVVIIAFQTSSLIARLAIAGALLTGLFYLIKLFNARGSSYPGGNFGGNQLLDRSISLSPL